MNSIIFIEYSGRYAIWKVGVVTRYEKRCIPFARVNFFRSCDIFAANQYLVPERKLDSFSKFKEGENFNRRNTLAYFED